MTTGDVAKGRRAKTRPDYNGPYRAPQDLNATKAWLRKYRPSVVSEDEWSRTREFVVDLGMTLLDKHDMTHEPLRIAVRNLSKISTWSLEHGSQLRLKVVLDPLTINQFAAHLREKGDANAATYQSGLRRIGLLLNPGAPWEKPKAVGSRSISRPYSSEEIEGFLAQIRRNRPRIAREGLALMALGCGAGLDGRWAIRVMTEDVIDDDLGMAIQVEGRVVPVLLEWEPLLRELLAIARPGETLTGNGSTSKNAYTNITGRIKLDPAMPKLNGGRLRATWIVKHLTIGTRLPELAAAAGTLGVTTISDLLEFVPALAQDQEDAALAARQMLRGPLT